MNSLKEMSNNKSIEISNTTRKPASFSSLIKQFRKTLLSANGKEGISTSELATRVGIGYEQFRKILNGQKKTKKRDCILAICIMLHMDADETNEALLSYYNYMPILNEKDDRDLCIINILDDASCFTIEQINDHLEKSGFSKLDIIDSRKHNDEKTSSLDKYTVEKTNTRVFIDDLVYDNPYGSIEDEYDPYRYHCTVTNYMRQNDTNKLFRISSNGEGLYWLNDDVISSFEKMKTLIPYYLKMDHNAVQEVRKLRLLLDDSRNYRERSGARVLDKQFYVYAESYCYSLPELEE